MEGVDLILLGTSLNNISKSLRTFGIITETILVAKIIWVIWVI